MDLKKTIDEFNYYLLTEKAQNPGTVRNYHAYVQRLHSFLGSDSTLDDITQENVEKFKKELITKGVSKKTVNGYLIGIRIFLKYCEKKKYPVMNPYDVEMYKHIEKKVLELVNDDELHTFLTSKVDDRSDLLVNVLFGTGLRIFEAQKLNFEDIKEVKDGMYSVSVVGKGNKIRTVYMLRETGLIVKNYMKMYDVKTGPMFKKEKGERLSIRGLQRIIEYRKDRLLKKDSTLSPHTLRHHFATSLLKKGMSLPILQKLLGHSSILTTQKYLQLTDNDTMEAVASLPNINKF